MDIKDADRVVIAKPVASRPTCSSFRSFSELLAGAINASSPHACTETTVPAIRPKTVRFKPVVNCSQSAIVSQQAELSGNLACVSSDKVSNSESKPTVLYKPQAMLVSKATVSLLANMGNFNTTHQQTQHLPEAPRICNSNQDRQNFRTQVSSNHQSTPSHTETDQTSDFSKMVSQDTEKDPKSFPAAAVSDRPSYDGYNWRKYGQKQVKGSEYPRSYYKCTHPSCPVKKKVERSFDGQIAEIVYKGEHNHLKPQAPKRSSSGNQGLGLPSEVVAQENSNSLWSNHHSERNEGLEGKVDNQNEVGILAHSSYPSKGQLQYQPVPTRTMLAGAAASDNSVGLSVEYEEGNKDGEDNETRSKRRKVEHRSSEIRISSDGLQEPRLTVQSSADPEVMSDGFRWRKYGQKVVKGSSYPRSYYRCTSLKCNVRKHVERASDDPNSFITTYEGKHNHEMPLKATNSVASEPDSQGPSGKDKL